MKNNLFDLLNNADKLKHYDDSYSRYHNLETNDIKGYDPNNPLQEVGTDIRHVLVIISIFLLLFIFVNK